MARKPSGKRSVSNTSAGIGIGGILKGLGDLVEKLGEVAETAQELSKTGELRDPTQQLRGMYGFTVKTGIGGQTPRVEPFGNIRKDAKSGRTVVQEYGEPIVDVFEEEDHVLVVAEMPGVSSEHVQVEIQDDVLTITAAEGDKKYRKEVLLPAAFTREKMQVSCNNGVLEIKCLR